MHAFENIRQGSIVEAGVAIINVFGLRHGSSGVGATKYDFYQLLDCYMNDSEARQQIHQIMEESKHSERRRNPRVRMS